MSVASFWSVGYLEYKSNGDKSFGEKYVYRNQEREREREREVGWHYLQSMIWFWEKPCVETSSLTFLDHARLQTWLPVSICCRCVPVLVFQKRMVRSAVPPPEAKRPCW